MAETEEEMMSGLELSAAVELMDLLFEVGAVEVL